MHRSVALVMSVGFALDVHISHLLFLLLWPFVFSAFSRVGVPLAACFHSLLVQVCSQLHSRGRTPRSLANVLQGGRENSYTPAS